MALDFGNCYNPWYLAWLYPERGGMVGPCCHFCPPFSAFPMPMTPEVDLAEFWNSEPFRKIRREIAEGSPKAEPCVTVCDRDMKSSFGMDCTNDSGFAPVLGTDFSDEQRENLALAREDWRSRREIVRSVPLLYGIRWGWKCNVDCIMCNHAEMLRKFPGEMDADWLKAQENHLAKALKIAITGGEVFAMEGAVDFIKWLLNNPKLTKIRLTLSTNALWLDRLSREEIRRLTGITVSMDGYGKYYEKVRRGSSWERVSRNAEWFLEEKKYNNDGLVPTHYLCVYCIPTHSGLPGLPALVRWVVGQQCSLVFDEVGPRMDKDVMSESITANVEPFRGDSGWREIIAECIAMFDGKSLYAGAARQLATIRDRIEKSLASFQ